MLDLQLDKIAKLVIGGWIAADELSAMVANILVAAGMDRNCAEEAAIILVETQLYGIDSHGVIHLPTYVRRLVDGAVDPKTNITVSKTGAAVAVIDGGNSLGIIVAQRALDLACDFARTHGIGACAVRNSNHFGAALPLLAKAARKGLVCLAFSNAAPTMAAWGGSKAILGTNPLAAAFPRAGGDPIIVDMATSVVSRGRIRKAARAGEKIPLEWALDEFGEPTSDANAALKGTVQPLAGAKGYALALMVELLATTLGGGRPGFEVLNPHDEKKEAAGVSHFLIAIDPEKFSGLNAACTSADRVAQKIEESGSVPSNPPRMPGSRGHIAKKDRTLNGVPLSAELVGSLQRSLALLSSDSWAV